MRAEQMVASTEILLVEMMVVWMATKKVVMKEYLTVARKVAEMAAKWVELKD